MLRKTATPCPACGQKAWHRDAGTRQHACRRCGYSDTERRAKQAATDWDKARVAVLNRDGWTCRLKFPGCEGYARGVDHVIPPDRGGGNHPDNLRAACSSCHATRARAW